MASGFKVADAYISVSLDDSLAKQGVRDLPQQLGADTDKAGTTVGKRMGQSIDKGLAPEIDRTAKRNGDKLAEGMNLAIIRNSPVIAAGIGAAMAAGAPVAIAGATALFAGIGVVAAAQSEKVKNAWGGAWRTISTETQKDASVMEGALISSAARITKGFEQMRPQLRSMFADAAPMIDGFVGSLVQAAQNAMPGFTAAVHNAGPVIQGLGTLLEKTGTGVGDFFADLSRYAPEAGRAFSQIGDVVQSALPALSTFLGVGAQVATNMLPLLSGSLGAFSTILKVAAPILPEITSGLAGWKIGQVAAGWLGSAASTLGDLGKKMGGEKENAGAFASALSLVGENAENISDKAGPLLGAAIGALMFGMQLVTDQANEWATALRAGGKAADEARKQMNDLQGMLDTSAGGWDSVKGSILSFTPAGHIANATINETKDALREQWEQMSPLQQAQAKVAEWSTTLAQRMREEGEASDGTTVAKERLAHWSREQAAAQIEQNQATADYMPSAEAAKLAMEDLSTALRMQDSAGATEALARYRQETDEAAAEQAALEMAIDGVTTAMIEQANQALAAASSQFAYDNATLQVTQAQQSLTQAISEHGERSMQAQQATNSLNQALLSQAEAAGRLASDALPATASELEHNRVAASATLTELYKLRDTMGSQFPAALQQAINGLERSGAAESGMSAQAYAASGAVQNLIQSSVLLGGQHPTPTVAVNDQASGPFSRLFSTMANLGAQRPTPVVSAHDNASGILGSIMNKLASIQSKTVTVTTVAKNMLASGGPVIKAASGRVVGPGTGTSDSVPAVGPGGQRWALSDGEWIIRNSAVRALEQTFGSGAMPTINSGRLPVATSSGRPEPMAKVQGGAVGGNTYNLTLNVSGVDLSDNSMPRKWLTTIRDGLVKIEREQR